MSQPQVLSYFRDFPWRVRAHTATRWRLIPFPALLEYMPASGKLCDIGCGYGLWPFYVKQERPGLDILGVDPDGVKIAAAQQVARAQQIPGLAFQAASLQDFDLPECSVISVIDVLYLIPWQEQVEFLEKAAAKLQRGGAILLKEIGKTPAWKYAWNYLEESLIVRLLHLTYGSRFYFRSEMEWKTLLEDCGLKASLQRLDHGYIHPHVLLTGRKE